MWKEKSSFEQPEQIDYGSPKPIGTTDTLPKRGIMPGVKGLRVWKIQVPEKQNSSK